MPIEEKTEDLIHQFEQPSSLSLGSKQGIFAALAVLTIITAGVFTGYFLSQKTGGGEVSLVAPGSQSTGKEIGSADVGTFKDTAIGVIESGGIDGEGTHQLIREGGPSQTAYLTSSIIDLSQFEGKKVQVWGETFKGQKAAWLMDVGRIKILE